MSDRCAIGGTCRMKSHVRAADGGDPVWLGDARLQASVITSSVCSEVLGSIVQVRVGQHPKPTSGDSVDIRVVAFAAAQAPTLRGLQEIFGVDADTARRIFDSVPTIVRRGIAANEAEAYVSALQSLGAHVVLEKPAANAQGQRPEEPAAPVARRPPPPPVQARPRPAPPPSPRSAVADRPAAPVVAARAGDSDLPLPRPVARALTADLEFDVLGELGSPNESLPPALSLDESGSESGGADERRAVRNARREEIELDASGSSKSLDIDPAAAAQRPEPTGREQSAQQTDHLETADAAPRTAATRGARRADSTQQTTDAQRGMSRAAVVQRPVTNTAATPRSLALLQILLAVVVVVLGVWVDNTIIYGNATLFSVIVHGLAIQQLGWGLWKLRR
jgi:ribosomal protein L7/L12